MQYTKRLSENTVQVCKDLEAIKDPLSVQAKRVTQWIRGLFNTECWYQTPAELFGVQHWDEMSECGVMSRTKYRYSQEQDDMVLDTIFRLLKQPQTKVTLGLSKPHGSRPGHLGEAIIAAKICHKALQHSPSTKLRMLVAYDPPKTKQFQQLLCWFDLIQKETGVVIEFGRRIADEEVDIWFV